MKKQLDEIYLMRPILVCICLVGYHAFAPFTGAWETPLVSNISIPEYYWLDKLLYSSMLESFVFISGYVFAFQLKTLNREYKLSELVANKFKRLLIPCVLFSVLYSLFFLKDEPITFMYIYDVVCGLGHMWFLPMLFWCFIFGWLISRIKIKEYFKVIILLCLSVFSIVPLPLQLKETSYYLFFFYLASFIYTHKIFIQRNFMNEKTIIVIGVLFFISFFVLTPIREVILDSSSFLLYDRFIRLFIYKSSRIIYSTLGLCFFFIICLYVIEKGVKLPNTIIKLNTLCMGIYLLQQFILKFLYFYTSEPSFFGVFIYPWVGFVCALIISTAITYIVRLTKIGRTVL